MLPGAAAGLRGLMGMGYRLLVVTNQSGIARGYFDEARLEQIHQKLIRLLRAESVDIGGIYFCPHLPEHACPCRKPAPGLVRRAATEHGFDPASSIVIGDNVCDIELGRAVGAGTILVRTGYGREVERCGAARPDFVADDLAAAAEYVKGTLASRQECLS